MSSAPGRVLIIDDDEAMRDVLTETLTPRGYEAFATGPDLAAIERTIATEDIDVVLTDLRMPGTDGLDVIRHVTATRPDVLVVMLTAFGTLDAAIAALRAGAWDFVQKPIDAASLQAVLDRALKHRRVTTELHRLRAAKESNSDGVVARSSAMRQVLGVVDQVAPLDVTVLITGESGTGKELIARALHNKSPRKDEPFVAVNCAALPENLLESQLFGHTRGAFTDANKDHVGLFAEARGGTILLDEFGELPLALQPKLLRALQERCFRPVGAPKDTAFDARIIVATNRRLDQMVEAGRFREDLYYRVNVVSLDVPPLRARPDDILPLSQVLLQRAARRFGRPVTGLDPGAARVLSAYAWPGNVRELSNVIERAVALARTDTIVAGDFPDKIRDADTGAAQPPSLDELTSLEAVERAHIMRVLKATGGNRGRASSILQIDPKTLYRKLRAWGESQASAAD